MEPTSRADRKAVGPHEVVAGRYRLDRSLGTSRMSEVFVATDLQLRRSVAVKRLPSSALDDATAKARFAREARALARVNDPNVVTVFDIVVDDERPFLIMELVDGMTLRELLDTEGRLDPERVVAIATGICAGLMAVHACGIVHRDMKPSNVFLTSSGAVKIGDFGIASVASDVTLTRAGEVFGSAPYVSPEQLTGDPVDPRADLYALGCVMFEMATGRPPFFGNDPAALAYQHVHTLPERADALVPQVPEALASTIMRLMAKEAADRPDSAEALRRSLEAMPTWATVEVGDVTTQPIAPPPSTDVIPTVPPPLPSRRPPRSSSPLPWIAGLVLAIVVLLVVNAIDSGVEPAIEARSPAADRSPSPASSSPSPASSSPSPVSTPSPVPPPAAGSVENAYATLLGVADELVASGAVEDHLARDLDHGVDEVVRELDKGDAGRVLASLDKLGDKVDKGLEHGEISPEDAQRLDVAIHALAAAVEASGEGR